MDQPLEQRLQSLAIDGQSTPALASSAAAKITEVATEAGDLTAITSTNGLELQPDDEKWGLPLNELYRLGLGFFKDKSGKAVHLSYEDNLKLIAFTQQVSHGPLNAATAPPLGVFDVIGRNRRLAWQQLGALHRPQAQDGFVELLDRLCPSFKPYVEAIKQDRAEKRRQADEQARRASEQQEHERRRSEEQQRAEEQRTREEQQRRQLQDALNQQTFEQFRAYAEKQYPGNPDEQATLIRQLQMEHYHQYMQQLQAQIGGGGGVGMLTDAERRDEAATVTPQHLLAAGDQHKQLQQFGCSRPECSTAGCRNGGAEVDDDDEDSEGGCVGYPLVSLANLWTRGDVKEFKKNVMAAKGDGVLQLKHGCQATVRVPTRENGTCVFWEFATDTYDIGFGVFFEWGKSPSSEVTVSFESESDDEDDDDQLETINPNDLELGRSEEALIDAAAVAAASAPPSPIISAVVPNYRRDSHLEVYAGSHVYPGDGTYLLRFDNSYSMWRSKTLYYKVFYTREDGD